jgi:hypothetical protein
MFFGEDSCVPWEQSALTSPQQSCPPTSTSQPTHLLCQHEVSVSSHGRSVGDEVSHGLHNLNDIVHVNERNSHATVDKFNTHVPTVFPPCQSSQNTELNGHQPQAYPGEGVRFSTGLSVQLQLFLCRSKGKRMQIAQIGE